MPIIYSTCSRACDKVTRMGCYIFVLMLLSVDGTTVYFRYTVFKCRFYKITSLQ